ncbi:MAG: glycosyltransferase [Thermoguttaceae bacterium]|nr:glycosyltransferase [Thermoguttaceae bacterium]MDW8080083.1 glycosyltransferase [Thermoguttaceae bacterium]
MRHRVLQIIPTLDRAGAEKQMSLLVRHLDPERFEPHVCVLTRTGPLEGELRAAGIPVHLVGKRFRADPAAYLRLRRLVRTLRPTIVHTWLFAGNSYGRLAAWQAKVPVVIASERCVDLWKAGWQFALDRLLAKWSDAIVVNSVGVRDFYIARGLPAEKIVVISNAVELPPEAPSSTREEILAELGLPQNARLVAVIGRLWPQKRIQDAIWAADLLKVVRKDVHLLVVGDGPQRNQLLRYRDQVEIADHVHFLGHRDDVPRLLPHVDILWSTSAYEGQSNAILEAMAHGRPVIATDIPGTRDLVVSGKTGFLFPVGDRMALARLTERLLEDPELAWRIGSAARQFVAEHFSVRRMVEAFQELYSGLIEAAGARAQPA